MKMSHYFMVAAAFLQGDFSSSNSVWRRINNEGFKKNPAGRPRAAALSVCDYSEHVVEGHFLFQPNSKAASD